MTDSAPFRKARGAFFTPPEITRFIAGRAVRTPTDSVLEPSCGEAAFLLAAGQRLNDLGTRTEDLGEQLYGIEIHRPSAETGLAELRRRGLNADLRVADFFDCTPEPRYDAVIGNPPYIRYQHFSGEARLKSLEAALAAGVRLTGLASSWAAFVVHASRFLTPEGRLGLVLPAELLTVNYAARVRRFLLDRFSRVQLVMFDTRVFPGVLEEVVLLLAEGSGGASSFEVFQARDLADLDRLETGGWTGVDLGAVDKWTPVLLSQSSVDIYRNLCRRESFCALLDWGSTYLGAVTGNNGYFTLSGADIARYRLSPHDLLPISPPGSRHLNGLSFTAAARERLGKAGGRCFLFYPKADTPRGPPARFIAEGEQRTVNAAYKCRMRRPWWRVPTVAVPDLLLTYMNHDRPRLITNEAGAHIINSVYGVLLHPERRELGRALLPLASLNSVTLLGAEMVGRAYGGGLLKLEPREADRLPLPSPETVAALASELEALRPAVEASLRRNDPEHAIGLVDEIMLSRHLGIKATELAALRAARRFLFRRRTGRGPMIAREMPVVLADGPH
ncbi:MAG: N-6 DNA methylase [Rhodospirillaceae bacterium]